MNIYVENFINTHFANHQFQACYSMVDSKLFLKTLPISCLALLAIFLNHIYAAKKYLIHQYWPFRITKNLGQWKS